ncbi:MAG: porin family protein [Gammaproteobacteria bacterium]
MLRIIIIFFGILLSSSVLGESVSTTTSSTDLVIGLSIGSSWVSGNQTQTINLQPDIVKTYTAGKINNAIPSFELFIGAQKPLVPRLMTHSFIGQLGLSVAETSQAKLTGDIWEDADPNFNNYNYKYKINHSAVSIKGRLIVNDGYIVEPYISGSMGIGINRASGFTITPKISEEVVPPAFKSNTTTTFSYSLGIGLQKLFYKNLQVAVGYEFADWGKSRLSPAAGQTTNQGLTQNHLYAQILQLSLFYA